MIDDPLLRIEAQINDMVESFNTVYSLHNGSAQPARAIANAIFFTIESLINGDKMSVYQAECKKLDDPTEQAILSAFWNYRDISWIKVEFDPHRRDDDGFYGRGNGVWKKATYEPHAEDVLTRVMRDLYPWFLIMGIKSWKEKQASVPDRWRAFMFSHCRYVVSALEALIMIDDLQRKLKPLYDERDRLRSLSFMDRLEEQTMQRSNDLVRQNVRPRRNASYL